jgi:hypothetical protein
MCAVCGRLRQTGKRFAWASAPSCSRNKRAFVERRRGAGTVHLVESRGEAR